MGGNEQEKQQIINIYAPDWDPFTGYGRIALELATRLHRAGVYVNALGVPYQEWEKVHNQAVKDAIYHPIKVSTGGIVLGYPTKYDELGGALLWAGPVIAITMFESTKLPEGWARVLNKCKKVIVPANFLKKVFKNSGVLATPTVIPLGVSSNYSFVQRRKPPDVFKFLCVADRGPRKGWRETVQAYHQAFGDRQDVKLIIKTRDPHIIKDITNINCEFIDGSFSEGQMQELFASVHCFVNPNYGEGFGLLPREAAATGLPVLVTKWGGTADGLPGWGYPIRHKLVHAWEGHPTMDKQDLGKWAAPDVEHLVEQMLHVVKPATYEMWHRLPVESAQQDRRVSAYVEKHYQWQQFTDAVWTEWELLVGVPMNMDDRRARRRERKAVNHAD